MKIEPTNLKKAEFIAMTLYFANDGKLTRHQLEQELISMKRNNMLPWKCNTSALASDAIKKIMKRKNK